MPKKQAPAPQIEPDDSVKLKPLLGLRPGVYLTILYSFILALVFFWLFVLHGLVNHGGALVVKTEPKGAAVRINDTYMGVSGEKIILPKSIKSNDEAKIEVILPGFEPQGGTYKIPGKVFGTRFFPRVYKLEYSLQLKDSPSLVLAQAAAEYAAWSFGGEPTEAWQIPLVLSETAYRIGNREQGTGNSEQLAVSSEQLTVNNEILKAASRFSTTRAALRDLVRAKFLVDNGGNSPSPAAVTGSISDMLVFLSENPQSAEWLASLLPPESAKVIRDSNWYKQNADTTARTADSALSFNPHEFGTRTLHFLSLSFIGTEEFLISDASVPIDLFGVFLTENPEWKKQYIDYYENEVFEYSAVTGVSWHAANAFCKWLTARLPADLADMEVRLPTESEWLFANNSGIIPNTPGWEWCLNPFAPLEFKAGNEAVNTVSSPERALYGRQTANTPATRASLPPDFASPVVTFRVVITVSSEQ